MTTAIQPRTLKTRARLVEAAEEVISETGFAAMRVEEVVRRAGVAKGTFFAHFRDKDALMDRLIGARIDAEIDRLAARPTPATVTDIVSALMPIMDLMTCERYVFDVILRHSGAAVVEEIGPIASTFERFVTVLAGWISKGPFRRDADPALLAEGVQAFMFQAMALNFCALNNVRPLEERLTPFLDLWLPPHNPLDPLGQ
jgi:AcrR family transcriptional regulator